MPLPNIVTPEFTTIIPSTNQPIEFRPFLVKEEKILLMAQEGKDNAEIKKAVLNVLKNCVLTPIEVDKLPLFDIEYLYLKLRSKSIGEVIKLYIKHAENPDCNHENEFHLNLDDVKVNFKKDHKKVIELKDGIGIEMKYPSLEMINNKNYDIENMNTEEMFQVIHDCVLNIFDKDQVYNDFTKDELDNFINKLSKEQFDKVLKFFETMPRLEHTVEFKCSKCGQNVKHELNNLTDFFL